MEWRARWKGFRLRCLAGVCTQSVGIRFSGQVSSIWQSDQGPWMRPRSGQCCAVGMAQSRMRSVQPWTQGCQPCDPRPARRPVAPYHPLSVSSSAALAALNLTLCAIQSSRPMGGFCSSGFLLSLALSWFSALSQRLNCSLPLQRRPGTRLTASPGACHGFDTRLLLTFVMYYRVRQKTVLHRRCRRLPSLANYSTHCIGHSHQWIRYDTVPSAAS